MDTTASRTRFDPAALRRLADAVPTHWKGAPLGCATSPRAGWTRSAASCCCCARTQSRTTSRAWRASRRRRARCSPRTRRRRCSPELIARQVEAGFWAVSAATPPHVRTLRRLGVQRILLARPQPNLAVVGAAKRDAPFDVDLPRPAAWCSADGARGGDQAGAAVARLNDQHTTIALPRDARDPAVGDLVRFAVSHPCGAFDRWRVIPLVDERRRVVGAVHTQL